MSEAEKTIGRRSLLKGGLIAATAWFARPALKPVLAQSEDLVLAAAKVDTVPTEPDDALWSSATATRVELQPQKLVVPRLNEAGATEINVRALYDSERIGLLVEWRDAHRDVDLGTVMDYRDGVALQFPEDPSLGEPSYTMGQESRPVVIYHWKSDWQFGRLYDVDEAYPNMYGDWYQESGVAAGDMAEVSDYLTKGRPEFVTAAAVDNKVANPLLQEAAGPVEKLRALGFGTLESDETQDAQGKGAWSDGGWKIAISIPRRQANFTFDEAAAVPVGFAVWDGSRDERNGQKAYSLWQELSLGAAAAASVAEEDDGRNLVPIFGGVAAAVAAAVAATIGLRMRRSRQETQQEE